MAELIDIDNHRHGHRDKLKASKAEELRAAFRAARKAGSANHPASPKSPFSRLTPEKPSRN